MVAVGLAFIVYSPNLLVGIRMPAVSGCGERRTERKTMEDDEIA